MASLSFDSDDSTVRVSDSNDWTVRMSDSNDSTFSDDVTVRTRILLRRRLVVVSPGADVRAVNSGMGVESGGGEAFVQSKNQRGRPHNFYISVSFS